ncbi:MAG: ribosome-associated translation inhibitor RaiA [Anaerolineales bacterium]|nr:ribosome-associated translation inhibitor RaiA [Anaerolineales bacterium]
MAVTTQIHARDLNVTPRLREYVEKKVSKLDRYLPTIEEARVDLAEVKAARSAGDRQVAQLTVRIPGTVLRAEERKDDIFAAVDAVLDKMYRQIERYKGKRWRGRGNGAGAKVVAAAEAAEEASAEALEEPVGSVVRRKRFVVTPMNEAEAQDQMQLLGHDNFFVFYNADTNRINVLYRRKDGDFGLIDPEIG